MGLEVMKIQSLDAAYSDEPHICNPPQLEGLQKRMALSQLNSHIYTNDDGRA